MGKELLVNKHYIGQLVGYYSGDNIYIVQIVDTLPNRRFLLCRNLTTDEKVVVFKDVLFSVEFIN